MKGSIIPFPEYDSLKEEIEKLRTELSMLLLEHDQLKYVECKNIEMQYKLTLGALEYKALELHWEVLRLKRKIEIIQAKKNRQEVVFIPDIDKLLDEIFAEYQEKLNEEIDKMNAALERSKGEPLSEEENKEIKTLYRTVIKALHPDINPNVTEAQIKLFHNAVEAYEKGDIKTLRIVKEMVADPVIPEQTESGLSVLTKEKERLLEMINSVKKDIEIIKNFYPYNVKEIVESEELTAKRKAYFEESIEESKKLIESYNARIEEMLR